jgi:hypothetical protein
MLIKYNHGRGRCLKGLGECTWYNPLTWAECAYNIGAGIGATVAGATLEQRHATMAQEAVNAYDAWVLVNQLPEDYPNKAKIVAAAWDDYQTKLAKVKQDTVKVMNPAAADTQEYQVKADEAMGTAQTSYAGLWLLAGGLALYLWARR